MDIDLSLLNVKFVWYQIINGIKTRANISNSNDNFTTLISMLTVDVSEAGNHVYICKVSVFDETVQSQAEIRAYSKFNNYIYSCLY